MNFKITFHLDGSGVYIDPNEPLHLDALLSWVLAPRVGANKGLGRSDKPDYVPLPLLRRNIGKHWVWAASALFPDGAQEEDLQFWRKRFRQGRADISAGVPNLKNGMYRDWNTPMPILLTSRLIAYASGNRKECRRLLRELTHLGKKRAHGYGKIIEITYDQIEEDWSILKDGKAMRWLPDETSDRLVRLRPPYWNTTERIKCCEVMSAFSV